jgi:hypothetical protein
VKVWLGASGCQWAGGGHAILCVNA